MALSAGDEMVQRLGSITSNGKTLSELVVADPDLLRKWIGTKKTTPEVAQQRAFAKLVLAIHSATELMGPPTGHATRAPVASAAAVQAAAVVAAHAAPPPKKRKVTFVASLASQPLLRFIKHGCGPQC